MGFLESKLNWATKKTDGSNRSLLAMILDPVGACIQPAELNPFEFPEQQAATSTRSTASETPLPVLPMSPPPPLDAETQLQPQEPTS